MKIIHAAYSKSTRTAIEAFNAAMQRAKAERDGAAAERASLESEALSGKIDVRGLRQRADACRERRLAADLGELQALKSLAGLNALHNRDMSAEADKQIDAISKREAEIEKKAAEMDAGPLQRHAMFVEDKTRKACELARQEAQTAASNSLQTPEDSRRIEELEIEVAAQVAALLR